MDVRKDYKNQKDSTLPDPTIAVHTTTPELSGRGGLSLPW